MTTTATKNASQAYLTPVDNGGNITPQRRPGPVVYAELTLWAAAAIAYEASGVMAASPGQAPLGLLIGAATPVVLFGLALATLEPVKRFARELDLGLLTAFQSWRVIGSMFLTLYALDQWPLSLFPTFFVPMFIIMHWISLRQLSHAPKD